MKNWLSEVINNIDKPLAKLTTERERDDNPIDIIKDKR